MNACAQSHVDHMVGGPHHVFVMLHHQHTVADVAQMFQGVDQPVVVALVQADAGLVQHVHHAGQTGADLRRQTDALRLAAAQCFGTAIKAQIVQSHIVEKLQTQSDFAHHLVGDLAFCARHAQAAEILQAFAQGDVADLKNGARLRSLANLDMARFATQPRTTAFGARLGAAIARKLLAHQHRIGFAKTPRHVGQDAFERVFARQLLALLGARVHDVAELDFLVTGPL